MASGQKQPAQKKKIGRPSSFKSEFIVQAEKLARLGATDKEMADFFGVSEPTFNSWKKNAEFLTSLKSGKEVADAEIVNSLFHRAKGYSHPDVHISNYMGDVKLTDITKHYPPDTVACIFWLKNRRPDLWRDKRDEDDTPYKKREVVGFEVVPYDE